ncbi:MAG TPA: glutamate synthase large subunit, partial [Cytophagales bacterium]|nr:glutamate synthase large subunit [Cytophagales bacterium]
MERTTGLYRPDFEHDACGIGAVVQIDGTPSYSILDEALTMLQNMEHRGATGANPDTGDGAGIMLQLPHDFLKEVAFEYDIELPKPGAYGVGVLFFPPQNSIREACRAVLERHLDELEFECLGYRPVPVNRLVPGAGAKTAEPIIEQVFVKHRQGLTGDELERKLFVLRQYTTHFIGHNIRGNNGNFYVPSFSSRVLIYKGQLRTDQLRMYYDDLQDERMVSALAMVHSRFSTNTFPNWKLAQPFRYMAHNGEINTIRGNLNKMRSKEALFESTKFSEADMERLLPVTNLEHSDSANLDALVEMLVLAGRSLPHVMMMLVPEAWQHNALMDPERKAFYQYHASLMEPWDGPAALFFTDGVGIGATSDRNGLRPARYTRTDSNRLYMASEAGTLDIDPATIVEEGRLQPGKMVWADVKKGEFLRDDDIKKQVVSEKPYRDFVQEHRVKLRLIPDPVSAVAPPSDEELLQAQQVFGMTREDLKFILSPMAETGKEPLGSMGADIPLAVVSKQPQHISHYFRQIFAQVSNPPIDPIRERLVMSLFTRVGDSKNILEPTPEHAQQVHISQPILRHSSLLKLQSLGHLGYHHRVLSATFLADGAPGRLEEGLSKLYAEAERAIESGIKILVISNRQVSATHSPIPSLLAIGGVHHHLIRERKRTHVGLIMEGGDLWETHHMATVIGFGASAVHPYLALQTQAALAKAEDRDPKESEDKYITAVGNGLLKIMSKMGISTLQSYQSAQIFEILGLSSHVVESCFRGTPSRIEGLGFDDLAEEILANHRVAYRPPTGTLPALSDGGVYQWKRKGETHLLNPETIPLLQKAARLNDYELYKEYANKVNTIQQDVATLRGLLDFKKRRPVPIEEVEPVEDIVKRFATGAMSFGSLSHEAHSTLAIAMNRMGGKSNSGEGGEDPDRYIPKENGDSMRSAIKQVASGRFGVTSHYLSEADEIQIKMAQGAKPGKGGQLPGHKVDSWIARVRHATPGVGLISPPPHHDIYSIEDLKQLIYDLKQANPEARINVKLVSEAGVGTIAVGVAKAEANVVMISGADGGTGASPLSSIRHAGLPWEIGLSEAQQTLVKNDLRSRVTVQVDGKILTGRDIAVATLLGAEEWGVSTAALIVEGCIMMRKCHLNTCPVGIATQRKDLRDLFTGDPDHVVNFFHLVAQDLREIMAQLGYKRVDQMVGQVHNLRPRNLDSHRKLMDLDLGPILHEERVAEGVGHYYQMEAETAVTEAVLDHELIANGESALEQATAVEGDFPIQNTDRSVGTQLSYQVSRRWGAG